MAVQIMTHVSQKQMLKMLQGNEKAYYTGQLARRTVYSQSDF